MQLQIVRDLSLSSPKGEFGQMYIDGEAFCVTCELPWNNNENAVSCIPEGDYRLIRYNSTKHGPTVIFENPDLDVYSKQVPAGREGRTYCEIHVANYPSDLEGCVAVGREIRVDARLGRGVFFSRITMDKLRLKWAGVTELTAKISSK